MKTTFLKIATALVAATAAFASCAKHETVPVGGGVEDNSPKPIQFKVDGLDMQVSTRASEVTTANLSSLNIFGSWGCYYYTNDDEAEPNTGGNLYDNYSDEMSSWSATATKSGNIFTVSGKYWPSADQLEVRSIDGYEYVCDYTWLEFICTNLPVANVVNEEWGFYHYIIPNCNTDWVYGLYDSSYNDEDRNEPFNYTYHGMGASVLGQTLNVTLNHLLSRIGTIAVNAPSGYTLTVNSMSINALTSYSPDAEDDCVDETKTVVVGSNDVWFCPQRSATLAINYTLTKGDFTKTYSKSQTFSLVAGKTHNLTINITTDEAQGIQLNSTVTAWSAQATSLTIN